MKLEQGEESLQNCSFFLLLLFSFLFYLFLDLAL
jgi:hypothetical protein